MSIYCSTFDFGYEHKPRCGRITKVGHKLYEQDNAKRCTCGSAPIIYQGSHVLPSDKDARGGSLAIAAIPGHIKRGGNDYGDVFPYRPWLRVSFEAHKQDTIILTRKQVEQFRDELTEWLRLSKKEPNFRQSSSLTEPGAESAHSGKLNAADKSASSPELLPTQLPKEK